MTTLFISHSSKDKAWAERTHAALSSGGYQCLFLDSHPDDGIHAGADWEQTLYQRLRQSRGVVVLCSANWLASPWCVAEAMMARERKRRVFLLATADIIDGRQVKRRIGTDAPQIPDFLKDKQFIGLSGISEDEAWQRLLDGLAKEGLNKKNFQLPDRPYPGLEPFTEEDGAIFFGRDEEIDGVIDVLHRRRKGDAKGFVVLLGASGCGKSSLVRAGVLPQLKNASKSDRGAWVIVPPFTGGQGLEGLAESLEKAFKDAGAPTHMDAIREGRASAKTLRSLCSKLRGAHDATEGAVLIVLDQLEEVFGTPEGSEARAALHLLLDASEETFSPVVALAIMRSDFLNAFQLFEGAAKRYEEVTLDPKLRSHFSEVIEGPAACFGLDLDPGLAERIKEDAAYADALPLLAYTLKRLFDESGADGKLELSEYEKLFPPMAVHGSLTNVHGVSAAIKITADKILKENGYIGLPADDPRMRDLRSAFYRLAQVGEKGQFTRRTARWSLMPDSCRPVLQRFVDQRLLVSASEENKEDPENRQPKPTLGVAHEALFRVWDTLNGWLRADSKALALRSQIEEAAAEWRDEKRRDIRGTLLWSEARVFDAVRKIKLSGVSLDDVSDRPTVDAFLGPTDQKDLEALPGLTQADDATKGSGSFGEAWLLPLNHEARASVGVRLAILGDRRKGVGLRDDGLPDIDWVSIDGGEVTIEIRAKANDPNSEVVKRPSRTVASFRMSRYPVTVAQFRAFLDDCHRDGVWRLPPGFPVDPPSSYLPPKPWARFDNHPVDSVNCFDASAFCHWLGTRLDFKVRLPTEFEWQRAATDGDPAREYPWGADWDPSTEPWRANTYESDLRRSTAVGMYPAGASAGGLLDMSGTVWEWCLNLSEKPSVTEFSMSDDSRLLRGGSWSNVRVSARSDYRGRLKPDNRNNNTGFRVVCSSPGPEGSRRRRLEETHRRATAKGVLPLAR